MPDSEEGIVIGEGYGVEASKFPDAVRMLKKLLDKSNLMLFAQAYPVRLSQTKVTKTESYSLSDDSAQIGRNGDTEGKGSRANLILVEEQQPQDNSRFILKLLNYLVMISRVDGHT